MQGGSNIRCHFPGMWLKYILAFTDPATDHRRYYHLFDLTNNSTLFRRFTCHFSAFVTVRRCQSDTDPTFVNFEPQAAVLVIVGLLAQFREFGCVFKQTLLQFGIVSVDLCGRVFGIVKNFPLFFLIREESRETT